MHLIDNFIYKGRLTEFTWFLIMMAVIGLVFILVEWQDRRRAKKKDQENLKKK